MLVSGGADGQGPLSVSHSGSADKGSCRGVAVIWDAETHRQIGTSVFSPRSWPRSSSGLRTSPND